ncbi:ABC transporter permease [Streptococcus caballi]|uniref:ABC transporter permease n=1 Tax=Streptococcus caballi TaxID=439220 RepID=UPI00037CB4A2|nr:ABC transporter permease [Streptococcus caballi]
MLKYILKRLGILLITLFFVVTISFFLMQVMPGTPYNNPKLTPEQIATLNAQYGLDKPVWQQYLKYLGDVFTGNLGISFQYVNQSVTTLIVQRLGVSAQLGVQALILGVTLGLIAGAISAQHRNDKIDAFLSIFSTLGFTVPSFVLGVFILNTFGYRLQWFDVSGWGTFKQAVLPTIALSFSPFAITTRFVRSQMIETLNSDYIQLAKAKGLTDRQVITRHAYRNSMIPVLTLIGPMTANLLTGSVLIERMFSIPGIGEQFVNSIPSKDFPVIMGTTIVYSVMLMVMILITDILTSIIDPRVRLQ